MSEHRNDDWDEKERELRADEPFMEWLREYLPEWESEYRGEIIAMHAAWKAGAKNQRDFDKLNADDRD